VRLEHLLSGEDQTVNRILLKEMVAYPPGILHYCINDFGIRNADFGFLNPKSTIRRSQSYFVLEKIPAILMYGKVLISPVAQLVRALH
jgi:hypothetical protein